MADLRQNTSYKTPEQSNILGAIRQYKDVFKPAVESAYKVGNSLPERQPQKTVDTGKYSGISSGVNGYSNTPPTPYTSTKGLGTTTVNYGGSTNYEKFHPAIDIANEIGTPIPSFVEGRVIEEVGEKKQGDKGYGNYIIVEDKNGNKHRYSHLSKQFVKIGDQVAKGQTIGAMGNTGSTYSNSGGTGSHLDYRVMDVYNKYINPKQFLM